MRSPCFLNSRGKKLYRRLKQKSIFEEKRSKKLQLRANIANIVSGIFAALISAGALYHAYNVSEKQGKFQRETQRRDSIQQEKNVKQFQTTVDLMNSYIEINDSLRTLTSQLLEQNRKNYNIQLQKNKSLIETVTPDLTIDSTAVYKEYIYPSLEFKLRNNGIFPAQNGQLKIMIIGAKNNTIFQRLLDINSSLSNKIVATSHIVAKIPKDEAIMYIKVHFKWYDLGLEKQLTNDLYFRYSFPDEDFKISSANKKEIARINELLELNLKELTISEAEIIFLSQIYPEYFSLSETL